MWESLIVVPLAIMFSCLYPGCSWIKGLLKSQLLEVSYFDDVSWYVLRGGCQLGKRRQLKQVPHLNFTLFSSLLVVWLFHLCSLSHQLSFVGYNEGDVYINMYAVYYINSYISHLCCVTSNCTFFWSKIESTTCSYSCSLRRMERLDLKSESVFLLCVLQCQSTHCNLPKVAAIYAIKHVFNIPEPHCVCVFLARSLTRLLALSHSLSCLPLRLYFYLCDMWVCLCVCVCVSVCVCVCSKWKRSLQRSSPFPPHRRIISPPLRQGRQEVGVYIGLLYPKKQPGSRSCRAWVLFLLLLLLLHFATASAMFQPPSTSCPSHGCLF